MIEINGISVYNSLAMGRLHFFNKDERVIKRLKTDAPEKELEKFDAAQGLAKKQLEELYRNEKIFGVDLCETGLSGIVTKYFNELIRGAGAVEETLKKYV